MASHRATSAGRLTRVNGAPEEIYQAPRHGDSLSLLAIRTHLGRCTTCVTGVGCTDYGLLLNSLRDERRYRGGR
jgi:hypothetical protein